MQYTFSLAASASERFNVVGNFLKLVAATGVVEVQTDYGRIDLLPGRGFRLAPGQKFNYFQVRDRSGGANVGTLLAGDFDLIDDRISGSVEVIDGGKSRTIANQSFIGGGSVSAVAGQNGHAQIWNPSGSGRRIVVKSFQVVCGVASSCSYGRYTAAIGAIGGAVASKLVGGAASVAEYRTATNVGLIPGLTLYANVQLAAAQVYVFTFQEPIVIPPNAGFGVYLATVNTQFDFTAEIVDEPNV